MQNLQNIELKFSRLGSTGTWPLCPVANNDKRRFTLHLTFGSCESMRLPDIHAGRLSNDYTIARYLSLPPTRHDLTQGQKPEGRLKWG